VDGRAAVVSIAGLALVAYATTGPPAATRAQPAPSAVVTAPPPEPDSATDACAAPASGMGRMLLRSLFGLNAGVRYRGPAYAFDILITTVPDPMDSHLDWAFDSQLEGVRRAFETSGWVTDRFWLPPRDSLRRTRGPGLATREACPGVLVFRRADPADEQLRMLYVVGETSNRGVLKPALFNALREREQLLANVDSLPIRPAAGDVLRIIGPSFSGSALSLRMALQSWPFAGTKTIEIVSGAATDPSNRLTLTSDGTPTLRFRATVNSDLMLRAVLDSAVLKPMGLDLRSVALLEESSTQYGQAMVELGRTAQGYLRLPFPMGVASLRTAYQRNPDTARAAQAVPGGAAPPRLPLDLIDPVRPKEDLPVTSQLSPAALDIILDQIARTLVDHQIRAVGLLFTDVRDKLVLADELKKRVHDLQLFTFESNVLYLRPDYGQALRGMLVLSTYPLITANQWWTGGRVGAALMFSSDGAEGTYNATLYQLGHPENMLDYRGGTSAATDRPPVWVTVVGANSFLPVTRVGPDPGFDPYLATIDGSSNRSNRQRGGVMGPVGLLPFLAIVFSGFALILLAWISHAGHEAAKRIPPPMAPARADEKVVAQVELEADQLRQLLEGGSLVIHERLYTLLRMIALLGVFISTGVLELRLVGSRDLTDSWWFWIILAVTTVAAAVAIARCAGMLVRLCRLYGPIGRRYGIELKWGDRSERIFWRMEVLGRLFVAIFGIAYLLLTLGFGFEVLGLSPVEFKWFFNRAARLGDLVSPLIPLIVSGVGFAVWSSWHLRRIRLLTPMERTLFERACLAESKADRSNDDSVQVAFRDDLHRTGRAIAGVRERLFLVIPDRGALVLLAFLGLAGLWLAPQFGHSIEAIVRQGGGSFRMFDWLLWVSTLSTLFATAWAVYRLHSVWRALRACLGTLQGMPLATAFERLPPRVARLAKLKLPALTRPPRLGAVANQQWQHLRRLYAEERSAFDATRALTQGVHLPERFASLMSRTSVHAVEPDEATVGQVTQNLLDLLNILRALWRLEPTKAEVDATVADLSKAGPADAEATMATSAKFRRTFTTPVRLWLRAAEEYVAVQVVEYIEWVTRHLRMLSLFLLLSLLLATALFSTYPFQPQALVRLVFFFLLLATVGSIVFVNAQMNRNDVLSRIAHTEPGKLTWDTTFVVNLITFGVVPLLAILSAALPGLRTALFSWADPLLKVLAKQ
jgi:hypothetical protein